MIEKIERRFNARYAGDRPGRDVLPLLSAGIIIGIHEVIFAISVASLIFSGALVSNLSQGVGIALITSAVTMISISLLGSIPGVIGGLQDSPSVIFAIIAAALVASTGVVNESSLGTILVIIPLSALLTGLLFLGMGYLRLGGLVRFFPYPVVGGFLAGTGWLLVQGSFAAMAEYPLTLKNIQFLTHPDQLMLWIPGVMIGIILFIAMKRFRHYLTLPLILLAAIIAIYIAIFATGQSIEQAIHQGLLLGGGEEEIIWQPLNFAGILAADWTAILGQSGNISIILILSMLSLLLNTSALELSFQRDIDFDRELRAAGVANLVSGLSGGMVGFHAVDASSLGLRIGVRSRLVGILAGLFCGLVLFTGPKLLALIPKAILGGLLFYIGLEFLNEWVFQGRKKLLPVDYVIVIGILIVIATTDFLIGVAVGLIATIILFVVNYSRIRIVRRTYTGADIQSNVERSDHQRRKLKELGAQVYVLELQGFIFFGTANSLYAQIKARLSNARQPPVSYIVLDFCRVSGLDSSAVFSFLKCRQIARAHTATLILTNLSDRILNQLDVAGLFVDRSGLVTFPDLDRGLEWCEGQLLQSLGLMHMPVSLDLTQRLVDAGFDPQAVQQLTQYLERVEVAQGKYLIHQGDESPDLYLIDCGQFSIYLEVEHENRLRLQTTGTRTVIGEIGLYLGTARTASVIADLPSVAYRLSKAALDDMHARQPELAAAFHEFAARQLAERLVDTTRLVTTLSD